MNVSTYTKGNDIETVAVAPISPRYEKSTISNGNRVDHDYGFSRDYAANRV
jgi:hypothetical protein